MAPDTEPRDASMGPLGTAFLRAARAPIEQARALLHQNRLGDGVSALDPNELGAAVGKGIEAAARVLGVDTAKLQPLVRHAEFAELASSQNVAQRQAIRAIRRNEGTVVSFGVPRGAEVAEVDAQLRAVASTFSRDRHIQGALNELADEMARWQQALSEAARGFDAHPFVLGVRRRKQMLLVGVASVALAAALAALAAALWYRERVVVQRQRDEAERAAKAAYQEQLRGQVAAALAITDPCTPDGLGADARALATADQIAKLDARPAACAKVREADDRRRRCDTLVQHVEAGQLTPEDVATAGAATNLLTRLAARHIEVADLVIGVADMPCAEQPASTKLWAALARVAARDEMFWARCEGVSEPVARALAAIAPEIRPAVARSLAFRAETIATKATGAFAKPGAAEHARHLCAVKAATGLAAGAGCQKLSAAK